MSLGDRVEGVWRELARAARSRWPKDPQDNETEADAFLESAKKATSGLAGPAASRALAAELAEELRSASGARLSLRLAALSVGLAPERSALKAMLSELDLANADAVEMEEALRGALTSPRRELLRLWLSLDGGLSFLVWLRERALAERGPGREARSLETELTECLSEVFAQGLLKMKPVDWNSPASLLEKIMEFGSDRAWGSWSDLKTRLGQDRRVYALFHSGWPAEPLCFLEVALTRGLASRASDVALGGPAADPALADTAVFYALHAPHAGLKGISFGEDLIRKAVADLRLTAPGVRRFVALSPIPRLSKWVDGLSAGAFNAVIQERRKAPREGEAPWGPKDLTGAGERAAAGETPEREKEALLRLCLKYLQGTKAGRPEDPVARFHLGNGAKLQAICFGADPSERGRRQSYGMMALYEYQSEELDKRRLGELGSPAASGRLRRQAR